MARPDAGVNNVCCFTLSPLNGRYCFHRLRHVGGISVTTTQERHLRGAAGPSPPPPPKEKEKRKKRKKKRKKEKKEKKKEGNYE